MGVTHGTSGKNKGGVTKSETIKTKLVANITILLVIFMIATAILLIWLNNEKNNKIISEVEEVKKQASVDTSIWDTKSVTIVKDTSRGYEINVPIPRGYVMSNVTGETDVKTGLVIYEGEEAVTVNVEGIYVEEDIYVNYYYKKQKFNMTVDKVITGVTLNGKEEDVLNNKLVKVDVIDYQLSRCNRLSIRVNKPRSKLLNNSRKYRRDRRNSSSRRKNTKLL